jgi:protease-4
MTDPRSRPSYAALTKAQAQGKDFLAPGGLRQTAKRSGGTAPVANREGPVSFFAEIAKFAIKGLIVVAILFLGAIAVVGGFAVGSGDDGSYEAGGSSSEDAGFGDVVRGSLNDDGDNKLAIVPVTGIIDSLSLSSESPAGWFADEFVTFGYTVKQTLAALAEDTDVKGVLLLLNTPGGTINGSKAISDGVAAYREATGQPVYAYVESISASGGMWSMAGADRIIADEGALVGSIGVIMGNWVYYDDPVALDGGLFGGGVETRGGIRAIPLTAGEGKDFGNPFREPSPEELAVIQASLDESYDVFRAHVAETRGLSDEAVRELGAMIYAPRQAQAAGLIDEVADFDAALAALGEAAGLGEDFAAVQQGWQDLDWFTGFLGSFRIMAGGGSSNAPGRRDAAATAAGLPQPSAGVAVCQRTEPLVLSSFHAQSYPGC